MKIEISNEPVEFVMGGQTMATFDFYELEAKVDEAYAAEKADASNNASVTIRDWMVANGLPDVINLAAVNTWLIHYMKAMDAETKKAIGQ